MSRHRGFTLIELLITIMIIGMLASMVLFGLMKVQAQTQAAKTKATIAKIDGLLRSRWESFNSRRLPLSTVNISPGEAAELRLVALRQIQRMELPDHWTEVTTAPSAALKKIDGTNFTTIPPILTRTGLAEAYLRYYDTVSQGKPGNTPTPNKPTPQQQDAECLFMILTIGATEERSGREMFLDSEIGDVDGDGAPEFLDGWGMPIRYIRWPVGFVDDPRQDTTAPSGQRFGHLSDVMPPKLVATGKPDAAGKHDAFDPLQKDAEAFLIYPLVYSGGPDKIVDIYGGTDDDVRDDPYDVDLSSSTRVDASPTGAYNPLATFTAPTPSVGLPKWPGIPHDLNYYYNKTLRASNNKMNHADNIHNHAMDASFK